MEHKSSFLKGLLTGAIVVASIFLITSEIQTRSLTKSNADDSLISQDTQKKLRSVNDLIEEYFLYGDEIEAELLQQWLVKGYVEGLNDPYSVYYNEEETRSLLESTSGEFGGIGVAITQDVDTKIISFVNVYIDSPAEKAGLKDGDIVYKVDGEDITGQDLDTVVSKIRGEAGTTVELTVYRGDTLEECTHTVTRDIIEVQTVAYEMKEGNIGYIAVSGFEQVTYHQFEEAIQELSKSGMEKMIVDLRNNPGGNYSTVCDMVDLILSEGTIVYTEDKYGNQEVVKADDNKQLDIPMAVLINGNSASASEIFAGAMQDYKKGTLVGTTTYGKGIVQQIFDLRDGTSLKLTTSEYFTPNGRSIHGIGIKPDVEVEYVYDETRPEYDNQLEKAISVLKNMN